MAVSSPAGRPQKDARAKVIENPSLTEDWELLSVLLGTGSHKKDVYTLSKEILHSIGGLENLITSSYAQIPQLSGIGRAKSSILISIAEIIRRVRKKSLENSDEEFPFINIYQTLWSLTGLDTRESFYLINLNLEGKLIRIHRLSQGSLTEVGVHKRDIAKIVLDDCSAYSLVAHNHPRHSCKPSEEDRILFTQLQDFLAELEVLCIDHWILGSDGLYSCRLDMDLDIDSWEMNNLPKEYAFLSDN
ncbi:MAG: hypothetical protein JJT78_18065 [Leptospira sp.]|nr:hypothetical protein [Leptospira sp.]